MVVKPFISVFQRSEWPYGEHPMADAPLPAYSFSMKHNKGYQDQYRLPDDDDEEWNQIEARFQRLARKVREESDVAQAKFVRFASQIEAPVYAQCNQELLPAMPVPS